MPFLLDTNAWIFYLKNPQSSIHRRLETLQPSEIRLCSIVIAELQFGARKYALPLARLKVLQTLFAPYISLSFDDACASAYAEIRYDLEQRGLMIGANDLLIASICVTHDLTLVTSNQREFSRVKGLHWEDWQIT